MEVVGVEPTMPEAADLQSAGVTNFPTLPYLVPQERLELSHLAIPEPKSGVSTNSTIGAKLYILKHTKGNAILLSQYVGSCLVCFYIPLKNNCHCL